MFNWYCLVHFPDGSERIRLVPGKAPVPATSAGDRPVVIKIDSEDGLWVVDDIDMRVNRRDYAAEIWVRPAAADESP